MLAAVLAPQSFMGPSGLLRKSQVPSSLSMQEAVVNVDATEAPTPPPPPAWATLRVGDGVLAGDMGFDPLGLASDSKKLFGYREAEIKHARLAMLAAAGWPLSEKLNGGLSEMFNQKSLLVEGGRAPSILNGGLGEVPLVYWLAALGLAVAVEQNSVDTQILTSKRAANYLPGDLQVDPLGMDSPTMRGAEILNGRIAMIAITGFAAQEAVTHLGVTSGAGAMFFNPPF